MNIRRGDIVLADLPFSDRSGSKSARVQQRGQGYLVDWTQDGRPIGIEMPYPSRVTIEQLNDVLTSLNCAPLAPDEVSPLVPA